MKKLLFILLLSTSLFHTSLISQWFKQTIPVNKPISGIKFIDSLKGWACTNWTPSFDSSYIINTTNGGLNWNIQFRGAVSLFAISMLDANTGYCGGSSGPGRLFKTTNGGLNWNEIGTPTRVLDMFFVNKDSGWIANETFAADVRTTTDGGATWQLRNSGLTDNINRIFFLNYSTGWAGSRYLKKTTNAGLNWVQIYDFGTAKIYSLFFLNEQTGWFGMNNNRVRYTTNGGFNWVEQLPPPNSSSTVFDLFFYNSTSGWAGTGFEKIFRTYNSGNNWGYQVDSSGSYRISFSDTSKGWSGQLGISFTTNGGGPITYVGIIQINNNIPGTYKLFQNYPNPFNSQTSIKFSITKRSVVAFKIYDILGREKSIWHSEQQLDAGTHELQFDAKDLASGVYFYSIIVSDESGSTRFKETRKMILVK